MNNSITQNRILNLITKLLLYAIKVKCLHILKRAILMNNRLFVNVSECSIRIRKFLFENGSLFSYG